MCLTEVADCWTELCFIELYFTESFGELCYAICNLAKVFSSVVMISKLFSTTTCLFQLLFYFIFSRVFCFTTRWTDGLLQGGRRRWILATQHRSLKKHLKWWWYLKKLKHFYYKFYPNTIVLELFVLKLTYDIRYLMIMDSWNEVINNNIKFERMLQIWIQESIVHWDI